MFQIDTQRLFSNVGDIVYVNCEFWETTLVPVLEDARTNCHPLNPAIMRDGFKKVKFTKVLFLIPYER